jgi:hypothetical protein
VFRILRAFAWLRWRVLVNSLERTGARDMVERFSLAIEQITPIIAFLLLVPTAIALAALAGYAGYALALGGQSLTFEALRFGLLVVSALAVLGPLLMPSLEPTALVRLLLLPIPRGTLYVAHAIGTINEPWVAATVPIVLALPVGLAVGGALGTAGISLVGGLLLVVCIAGVSTIATLLVHAMARNRRRGELIALAFMVIFPLVALLPGMIGSGEDTRRSGNRHPFTVPQWLTDAGASASRAVPSEVFVRATRYAVGDEARSAGLHIVFLFVSATLIQSAGFAIFRRLLERPSAGGARRASGADAVTFSIPFLSRASAAVARNQLRLAMRTPRGRAILLSPLAAFAVFAVVFSRVGQVELGFATLSNGLGLAVFGGAICLIGTIPFAVNQFAVDRAGLTLTWLSPISTRDLLWGKAVANGLIALAPMMLMSLISLVVFPGGPVGVWLSLPLGLIAATCLFAPAAATLSAVFPKAVDLNSIGRGSNPHGMANFLGIVSAGVAGVPSILIGVLTAGVFGSPTWTVLAMLGWCALSLGLSLFLFRLVAMLVEARRENLAGKRRT